jgi:hypothetical protein
MYFISALKRVSIVIRYQQYPTPPIKPSIIFFCKSISLLGFIDILNSYLSVAIFFILVTKIVWLQYLMIIRVCT